VLTGVDVQPRVMVADGRVTAAVVADTPRRAVTAEVFPHTVAVLRTAGDLRTAAEAAADMGGKARLGSLPA
jgi:hypothetical protein